MGFELRSTATLAAVVFAGSVGALSGCKSEAPAGAPATQSGSAGKAAASTTGGAKGPAAAGDAPAGAPAQLGQAHLRAAGDGLLTVALRPDGWPALHTAILKLASAAPPEMINDIKGLTTLPALLASEVMAPFDALGFSAEDFAAADLTRPWFITLFAPPEMSPAPGAASAAWLGGMPAVFTHIAIIPSKDAKALAAALSKRLADKGEPEAALRDTPAWRLTGGRARVALNVEQGYLRVVVETGALPAPNPKWLPRVVAIGGETEGDRWLLGAQGAVGIRLRNRHLRGWAAWSGLGQMTEAFKDIPAEMLDALRGAGLAIVLGGEYIMGSPQTDFDEQVLAFAGEADGVRIYTASTADLGLTSAIGVAHTAAAESFAYQGPTPALQGGVALDLGALLKSRSLPAFMQGSPSLGELSDAWSQCGYGCALYSVFHAPISMLKGGQAELQKEWSGFDPAFRLLTAAVVPDAEGLPAYAVAAAMASATPPPAKLLEALKGSGTLEISRRKDQPVALFVSDSKAGQSYDMASEAKAPALAWFDLDVPQFVKFLPEFMAPLGAAWAGTSGIHLRWREVPGAVVGEGMINAAGTQWQPRTITAAVASAKAPELPRYTDAAAVCLSQALTHLTALLNVGRNASPDQVAKLMYPEAKALKPALTCLAADPVTAPMVEPLRKEIRARLSAATLNAPLPDDVP